LIDSQHHGDPIVRRIVSDMSLSSDQISHADYIIGGRAGLPLEQHRGVYRTQNLDKSTDTLGRLDDKILVARLDRSQQFMDFYIAGSIDGFAEIRDTESEKQSPRGLGYLRGPPFHDRW
jgi:hypothetical protein